jgi:hypothetical protein
VTHDPLLQPDLVPHRSGPKKRRLRVPSIVLLTFVVGAIAVGSAAAAPPTIVRDITITPPPSTLSGVCSFDVTVGPTISGFATFHYDSSGTLIRIFAHATEQDLFSANGKTISGQPYRFNVEHLYDAAGDQTAEYSSGVVERLVLPSGTLFLSAGRTVIAGSPTVSFGLSPDRGNPGNVAAFCAALA